MKIAHFSDTHIHSKKILGYNPVERFQLALEHLKKNHSDSDMLVISGDISHHGVLDSYKKFDEIIETVKLPKHLYPKLILGNHDNREIFKNYFINIPFDENGFVQYEIEIEDKKLIFLDTNLAKSHQGEFCQKRQAWLKKKLEENIKKNKKILIFMHHNPSPLAELDSDFIGLLDRDQFKLIINEYKNMIQHIFFGHQHLTVSGNYLGIPFSSPRSINHPLVPNFSKKYRLGSADTDPNYNIILINKDSTIVHNEDFLKPNINWFETTKSGWVEENEN